MRIGKNIWETEESERAAALRRWTHAGRPFGEERRKQSGDNAMKHTTKKKKVRILADLKQSLHEALSYEQGKKSALRVTELPPSPKPLSPAQIRAIRRSFNVSQVVFARIINVSPNTVESWEQGARHPRKASLKLLTIAHKHPEALLA